MNYKTYPNLTEFRALIAELNGNIPSGKYLLEWSLAVESGWDDKEFEELYEAYVKSTQIDIKPGDDPAELKGRPLESVGRYFLEKGGLAYDIKEISDPGKWQVDGCGPVNKTAILLCWGEDLCQRIGIQLYMEAKNHSDPVENSEFSEHYRRMEDHHCNLGVMISTSGYKIGRGKGIAESVYINSCKNRFHVLLVFQSLTAVINKQKPPLIVIQEALVHACNNTYTHDKKIQKYYSQETCQEAATTEYKRISSLN